MAAPPFDPNGAVRFDLRTGAASDSRGARLVLVPSAALASLGPDALTKIGLAMGRGCGERVASRLGGDAGVRAATIELVISHLAGELAIAGAFAMHLERWGRAMVAVVSNPSITDDVFVGAVLAGAISAASGREIAAASLGREANPTRYFLGSPPTADHVRVLVGKGLSYAEVLASLQGGTS
jgi:hypothetical protein